jgi:hypothetical protein
MVVTLGAVLVVVVSVLFLSSSSLLSSSWMVDFPYCRCHRCSVTDNHIHPLTPLLQSLYCPHITHIAVVKISAAIIRLRVSFFLFFELGVSTWRLYRGGGNLNKCNQTTWSELHGDVVCIERVTSQFCSAPWVSYTLGCVLVCSQPKGVKPKMSAN